MERSRGPGRRLTPGASSRRRVAARASRLTFRPRKNRKKAGSLWSRLPRPAQVADACGRALRRSVPALVAVAVGLAIGGTAWAGYRFVTTRRGSRSPTIEVRGNHHLTTDAGPRRAAGSRVGDNVFATNLGARRSARCAPSRGSRRPTAHRDAAAHDRRSRSREHAAAAVADLGGAVPGRRRRPPVQARRDRRRRGAGLPIVTGLDRAAYVADPDATAAQVRSARSPRSPTWRADARPPRDRRGPPRSARRAHARTPTTRRSRSSSARSTPAAAARMQTFDAAWAELADTERARARADPPRQPAPTTSPSPSPRTQ